MTRWYTVAVLLTFTCGWTVRQNSDPALQRPDLVERFYQRRDYRLFWFSGDDRAPAGRRQLLQRIDSAAWFGLDSGAYRPGELRRAEAGTAGSAEDETNPVLMAADRRFTDAALSLAFDCWRGAIDSGRRYDGVSPKFERRDEAFILDGLNGIGAAGLNPWLDGLRPAGPGYDTVLAALRRCLNSGDNRRATQLASTLNTLRFVQHFGFDRFIIVNIPSAALRYYVADTLVLRMRVVAGQATKRTPRFAAWCNGLVLYPYWNIPHHIAVTEFLPLLKRSPQFAAVADFQVLDQQGRIVDATRIDWKKVHPGNFPYTHRQTPGCENALGVLKFELNDPFNVYMHDTNFKRAFGANYRYLSHGCIRLEKAAQLGDLLLDHHLDTAFLSACLRDQQPKSVALANPVPVFVVYLTAIPDTAGRLSWYKDIYHLLY